MYSITIRACLINTLMDLSDFFIDMYWFILSEFTFKNFMGLKADVCIGMFLSVTETTNENKMREY